MTTTNPNFIAAYEAWASEGRNYEQRHGVQNFLTSKHFREAIEDYANQRALEVIGEYDDRHDVSGYKQWTFYRNNLRTEQRKRLNLTKESKS